MNVVDIAVVVTLGSILVFLIPLIISLIRAVDSFRKTMPEIESAARNFKNVLKESKEIIKNADRIAQTCNDIAKSTQSFTDKTNVFAEQAYPKVNSLLDDVKSKSIRLETTVNEVERMSKRIQTINDNMDKFVIPIINNFAGLADKFENYIKKYNDQKSVKNEGQDYETNFRIQRKVEDE